MYVCVCLAVTQVEVDGVIEAGAHTREAVTRACRAGGDCGSCHGMIEQMIEDHLDDGPTTCPRAASSPSLIGVDRLARDRSAA